MRELRTVRCVFCLTLAASALIVGLNFLLITQDTQHEHPRTLWLHVTSNLELLSVVGGMWWLLIRPIQRDMQQAMRLTEMQQKIIIAANSADSIASGLQASIDHICAYTGWSVGHAYLFSEEENLLRSLHIWHGEVSEFQQTSYDLCVTPGDGFIGEVYAEAMPMWILDVADSSVYRRQNAATAAGLKAAFAFPILVGERVVAVMEFYSPQPKIPAQSLLEVMTNIGKQLGQVIEREQFKERASLLETVITSANDGIIITKANLDNPGPEIIYVNKAFTDISGYSAEEVIGRNPRFLQSEFTKRETLDALKAALKEGKPFKDELLNVHKNGSNYWLEISIVPVRNAQGVVTHFAAIEHDISARKREEMEYKNMWLELRRANLKAEAATRDLQDSLKKAEEANKAKSDFLANMSHELRTPMNGVLGMAHLLTETDLNAEQRDYLATINSSGEGLLMLLNDILDFSKIEAGALVLEEIAYSPVETLERTAQMLQVTASKKAIELLVDVDSATPPYVMGDPGRMRQIVTNLLGNAIKFTQSGYVRLSLRLLAEPQGQMLHVRVEDTGVGIPADKLGEIFEKFTQADASVTRRYGGTGLGLAITKQLISMMGGAIGVESVEGKGSTFWFSVPCVIATTAPLSTISEQSSHRLHSAAPTLHAGDAKVLLVEDYPVNQVFAMTLLKKFGFRDITLAENGSEALLKYRTRSYDVIFMDCQMPEIDGYQATSKIRELETGTPMHTPIIAMTANAMMGDREKCLKSGMDDYISKPLRTEHLRAILQNLFVLAAPTAPATAPGYAKPALVKTTPDEPPVDMEHLRSFTDGDPEEEKVLAEMFLDQAKQMITLLEQSIAAAQEKQWESAAHRFKGSSGNLGAMKLHHLCKRAEAFHGDDCPEKREILQAIIQETNRVEQFFAQPKLHVAE